jgi:hypothetical protein
MIELARVRLGGRHSVRSVESEGVRCEKAVASHG